MEIALWNLLGLFVEFLGPFVEPVWNLLGLFVDLLGPCVEPLVEALVELLCVTSWGSLWTPWGSL